MKKLLVLTAVMLLMMSTAAFADSISVVSVVGNTVTFQVQNTGSISSVTDAISGFFFTCSGCSGPLTVTNSGSGATADVASNGSFTTGSTTTAGWGVSNFGGNNYFMSTFPILGGSLGPEYTIIGDTIACTQNGSICGNSAHNPFLYTPTGTFITFAITIPGVTSSTQLSNLTLWYGTEPPTGQQTPEPASMFLLGTGLLGIGGAIRRKIRL
jgi:PEP-CTERM motif